MKGEFVIELKDLWFYSFHGLYEEERKVGGEFFVDLFVKTNTEGTVTSIDDTINYAALYSIVKTEMNQPRDLLETIAQSIASKIHQTFPSVREMEICITKKNPPISGFNGNVAVHWKNTF